MDMLIRERNGKDENWYSEKYLQSQIELAYSAGIHKGIRVDFHALEPMDGRMVDSLVDEFHKRVSEECQKAYANSEIYRIVSK